MSFSIFEIGYQTSQKLSGKLSEF